MDSKVGIDGRGLEGIYEKGIDVGDSCGIDGGEYVRGVEEGIGGGVGEALSFDTIVPKEGVFLGLDISKNSTGITYIENGDKLVGNITLDDQKGVHKEVLLRRALKEDLKQLVDGKHFDLIVIEDAFIGDNAEVVRKLYALNTAIDELILDGVCSCEKFVRVNNQQWKSWLYSVDKEGISKGLNDKEKIRICLELIGVVDDMSKGYQDRLDSTGLIVGYFLKGNELDRGDGLIRKKKVKLSDVDASYDIDSGYLFYGRDDVDLSNPDDIEFLDYSRIGKTRVLELLTEHPDKIFITSEKVKLGNLGEELGLDILEDGGYFAFWIKQKKKKKYLEI